MSVFRCYSMKKPGYDVEAQGLCSALKEQLGIAGLEGITILNRYDADQIDPAVYEQAKSIVFSEPQVDAVYDETFPAPQGSHTVLAVEALPGQFDQRADSCAQCIQLMAGVDRPLIAYAKVYILKGTLTGEELDKIRDYLINPVESREASMDKPDTLVRTHTIPDHVDTVAGFTTLDEAGLQALLSSLGLAMDLDDLKFLQTYFRDEEKRDPTITEVRVVDTYWSDHCRHTTFSTHIDSVELSDEAVKAAYQRYLDGRVEVYGEEKAAARPQTLMDIATLGTKVLKKRGLLPELDESEEINACSIHVPAMVDGKEQDWLLMFKNETHNHPTEIEPFGGAATCIGGCIRDPLSGRVYVHQAMRVTGGGDPRVPFAQTTPGKLPQRKLAQTAAAGYSSYGNQIGLATGHVAEVYHEGYIAKRLECGAVVGAAPADHVRREVPAPGDVVILLGGRTGRDGIGGATGSSKSHNMKSLTTMASEVQKGNAPEERKIQRLFRNGEVTRLIKRCNDFGAGGVSVAIGELADGLEIELDAVRKKYDGLDGTELAISESQERMAVVVAPEDADKFIAAAEAENLEAYRVAVVTESPRMVMHWKGQKIADLSRAFLNTNGAVKHARVEVADTDRSSLNKASASSLKEMAASLKCASRRGLTERFDGSIGAASVLMPFGGAAQRTPAQAMAALFPVEPGQETDQASVMAWGFDPERMSVDPYTGAHESVYVSMAKIVAAGADYQKAYLTFQEFFEKLRDEPQRWGKPFAALLGGLDAQLELGAAAIGGKDSMSGSFLDKDVPPTLISFAIAPLKAGEVLSPEFKAGEHPVYLFRSQDTKSAWSAFHALCQAGKVKAAWAVENGLGEAVMNMSFGNSIGFQAGLEDVDWYVAMPGAIVAELSEEVNDPCAVRIGETTKAPFVALPGEAVSIEELQNLNDGVLEKVYATRAGGSEAVEPISWDKRSIAVCKNKVARPKAVIPVFPGTNCEYDTAKACLRAGIEPEIIVVRNLTTDFLSQAAQALEKAIRSAQMMVLPGGFSGGDEPEGSGKFIASFLRSPALSDAIMDLLKNRDGLMLGICNGFQALIKLGLVPYGEIRPMDGDCPTLTYNLIGRHQSRYVTTRVASVQSPWMLKSNVGDLHTVPISHGEGRFVAPAQVVADLIANGQVATQYVDLEGKPSMDIDVNPNGSMEAIEGIFSPDGRVFGKMGHSERRGPYVGVNIPGEKHQPLFESGALYFR
ncbi:phosphoribosylformylglycinamidine synthase [Pseudoflavonifractor sp. AF19-9AC]|uniref:phosphoribosylformylglycinamidine synthase n=1 Tax=Pseudoflavonifractor sp. AF19-9AC TaxID=2292244 RepID=UPI000E491623|nr:phosphoribosylformylglycinamidine synthase [Pseudoflavonifractor sp. AF19-9AC]RHR10419.1 phosphoribosylformylglycinamidine synthase [Pseudoflavonifractor sp. AF19-9AC]